MGTSKAVIASNFKLNSPKPNESGTVSSKKKGKNTLFSGSKKDEDEEEEDEEENKYGAPVVRFPGGPKAELSEIESKYLPPPR